MAKLTQAGYVDFAFFPYPATDGAGEIFEFLTDVVLTHNGDEDTTPSRSAARHNLKYSFAADLLDRRSPFNLADQNIRGNWAVPLWLEAQSVGSVSGTTINCDPKLSDYRVGNLVLVYRTNLDWQLALVDSVGETSIVLTTSISPAISAAYLIPVSRGLVSGSVEHNMGGASSSYDFTFNVLAPRTYPTRIGVFFAINGSSSMGTTVGGVERWTSAKENIATALGTIRNAMVNSGVSPDIRVCVYRSAASSTPFVEHTLLDPTLAQLDALIATVRGMVRPLISVAFTEYAFTRALQWFETDNPNPGDRQDMFWLLSDDFNGAIAAAAEGVNMIGRTAPFAGLKDIDCYPYGFDAVAIDNAWRLANTTDPIIDTQVSAFDSMSEPFRKGLSRLCGVQWGGYEVLSTEPTDSGSTTSKGIGKQEDLTDFGGAFSVRSPWLYSRVTNGHSFILEGAREVLLFKRFMYRRMGRARKFYMPTFQHDLHFTELNGDRTVGFRAEGDIDAFTGLRRTVVIKYVDGSWQPNEITAVDAALLGGMNLTFRNPFEQSLDRVNQVSYMTLSRFVGDRVELKWVGADAVKVSIGMTEVSK